MVEIPENCPAGTYEIGFGDKVDIFKEGASCDEWKYQEIKGIITVESPISIVKQPEDAIAASGEKATVTVNATGDGLTYKWYYKNKGASKFSYTSTFTGNTYSTAMSDSRDGRQIYCVITDKYGNSVTTDTVTLIMGNTVEIVAQPESTVVPEGKKASVTVSATGDGLTYTWYVCSPTGTKFTKSSITSATYFYAMTADKSGRKVYCVITDKYGNSVKTDTVILSQI